LLRQAPADGQAQGMRGADDDRRRGEPCGLRGQRCRWLARRRVPEGGAAVVPWVRGGPATDALHGRSHAWPAWDRRCRLERGRPTPACRVRSPWSSAPVRA